MSRYIPRVGLLVATASVLVPFLYILLASLHPQDDLSPSFAWPADPQWHNYIDAFTTASFGSLLRSSAIIALVVVPLAMVLATLAGYGLSMTAGRVGGAVFALFMLGLALPLESIVIPLYYDLKSVGLLNTYWAVILPLVAAFMPFGVYWMRSHFDSLPVELTESAKVDGASTFQTLTRVLLPTAGSSLTTLGLLFFMWSWNQFLLVLILIQDPAKRTAPSGLGKFVMAHGRDIPLLCAGTVIVIIPVVVLYLFFQRHFIRGILQGAVK